MLDTFSTILLPPFITIATGFYIAAMAIYRVRVKTENALFSLLCLLWTLLSISYLLKQFVERRETLFFIEQATHFLFAYYPFVHIVFIHKLLNIRGRSVPLACFLMSVFFSAAVFTPLYMDNLYAYSWGYIAHAGPLLYAFLVYCTVVVVYFTWEVLAELKKEVNLIRRIKLRYILFAFVLSAVLTMTTAIPMSGYDLYLPGNFIFIPMAFLGYGLLRYRILGIRTLLHMSVLWFFSSLFIVIPNGIVFMVSWPLIYKLTPSMMFWFFVFWFFINFHFVIRTQPFIDRFFNKNSYDLKKAGLTFFESMLLLRHTPELVNEFRAVVKRSLGFTDVDFYLCSEDGVFENDRGEILSVPMALGEWFKDSHRLVEGHIVENSPMDATVKKILMRLFEEKKVQFIVPMAQHGTLMALAFLQDTSPDRLLTKEEARFIEQMSGFVSVALFNSRVYVAMTRLKDRLEEKTLTLSNEISIRRQAEEKVKESWARYKLLADNVIDIIWVIGVHDLKFSYISPSVERLIGYSVQEIVGKGLELFLTPESYAYVLKSQDTLISSGWLENRKNLSMELEHICKDGRRIWVEVSAHVLDDDRWADSLIGISRDITERKHSEKEKKILEARLMQAQKMESIGVLAGGIAHDFNNILMSILGYTQLARLYVPDENKAAHEKLSRIEKASFRAKDMVSQILAFSRQSEPSILPVQMGPIVLEAIKLLKGSLPSTLSMVTDFQDNIRSVLADPVQIHQVVINLCSNAAHAMEDHGGVISVSLREIRLEAREALSMNLPPGYYVRLTVSDTGCGMDDKIREKIFDPYFTTKDVGKGSGMGLAVVHGIVVSCGGKITVESVLGEGATFNLLFPASDRIIVAEKDPADRLLHGNERILFVDDEKDIVDMTRESLGTMGYRVTGALNGTEAFHVFSERPDEFDMVITDLTMPGLTGERLAHEIHAMRPDVPVILCTGYNTYFPDEKAKESGIRDILIKPVPARDMAEAIRDILDGEKQPEFL